MFDPSAPHIIILLVVVLLLFGSTRLPGAARALGQSMHIFRRSVKGIDDSHGDTGTQASAIQPGQSELPGAQPTAAPTSQAQIDALQRQIDEMQRREGGTGAAPQNQQSA